MNGNGEGTHQVSANQHYHGIMYMTHTLLEDYYYSANLTN